MPELPDITIYMEALRDRIAGERLETVRIKHPFLLRNVEPAIETVRGQTVSELRRIGKRIAIGFQNDVWLVLHLMIAGRLQWQPRGVKLSRKLDLAAFDFDVGSLLVTEASTKKRAPLHVAGSRDALRDRS